MVIACRSRAEDRCELGVKSGQCTTVLFVFFIPINPCQIVGGLRTSPHCLRDNRSRSAVGGLQLNDNAGLGRHGASSGVDNHNRARFGHSLAGPSSMGRIPCTCLGVDFYTGCRCNRSDTHFTVARAVMGRPGHGVRDRGILVEPVYPGTKSLSTGGEHNECRCLNLHCNNQCSILIMWYSRVGEEGGARGCVQRDNGSAEKGSDYGKLVCAVKGNKKSDSLRIGKLGRRARSICFPGFASAPILKLELLPGAMFINGPEVDPLSGKSKEIRQVRGLLSEQQSELPGQYVLEPNHLNDGIERDLHRLKRTRPERQVIDNNNIGRWGVLSALMTERRSERCRKRACHWIQEDSQAKQLQPRLKRRQRRVPGVGELTTGCWLGRLMD